MIAFSFYILSASLVGAMGGPPTAKRARMEAPMVRVSEGLDVGVLSRRYQRIFEVYNYTEISRVYGEEFAGNLWDIVRQDESHDQFTPQPNLNGSENTPYGVLELGARVASSEQSVIFRIVGHPNMLIKYQANCMELDPKSRVSDTHYVHPLVVDYIFGKKAAVAKVGPRIFYLSPPSQVCLSKRGKCGFKIDNEDFHSCVNRPGASLRYMIMERVNGESLHTFKERFHDGIVPFHTSLLIGFAMIAHLERLHTVAKTVHGDIHNGNIMLDHIDDRNGTISLKFIDYGRAFTNSERLNETIRKLGWAEDCLFSRRELEGYDPAPRDDIERAIHITAQLMMPWSFDDAEETISEYGAFAVLQWKRSGYWFIQPRLVGDVTPGYDPVAGLRVAEEYKYQIRYNLQVILRKIREMGTVNSIPPYADLLQGFRSTRSLVHRAKLAFAQNTTTMTPSSFL